MTKYLNYCNFLSDLFTVETTCEEFKESNKIKFICKKSSHINILSATSFGNKKTKVTASDFCQFCKDELDNKNKSDEYKKEIKDRLGHIVKEIDFSTRKVIYICDNCGSENNTFTQNFNKENRGCYCPKCQNNKNRKAYNDLKIEVERYGYVLLTKQDDYTNNKQKLEVLCQCGKFYLSILSDIKREKSCQECKLKKFKETCQLKYGVDNVAQDPIIFEKIFIAHCKRKEFEFPNTKRVVTVMGYEPNAIQTLLSRDIDPFLNRMVQENDIIVGKEIKRFRYEDNEGVGHVYFPDLYINGTSHIIEVKSDYTFYKDREKNIQKFNAVVANNYVLRLMIYNDKKLLKYEALCKTKDDIEKICSEIDLIKF